MTKLLPYVCPNWAEQLKHIPRYRVQLAHANTPIHKWDLPSVPRQFQISIKRDDMTGSTLSGNKVRKLEFLLADALVKNCKHVITGGGVQSNHCRATAVAARQLGLHPHLMLRGDQTIDEIGCEGNLLLDSMCRADMYLMPRNSPYETELKPRMTKLAAHIKKQTGEDSYLIPIGGSNTVGLFGYITMFEELKRQGICEEFDDIVVTCGSGGTTAGISIANYLTGSQIKCHAIIVSDNKKYFADHIDCTLKEVGLGSANAVDIVDIIEGYKGRGYGISTEEDHEFIIEVAEKTGIMLDPVYTGKAAKGLVQEINTNPQRFQGNRILFVHTGGMFGLCDGLINPKLLKERKERDKIKLWPSIEITPWV